MVYLYNLYILYNLVYLVVLPPPVHFWKYADLWPYKTHDGKPHTICMGEAESPPTWPYLTYKVHADHPRGRREEEGSIGYPRRHGFPREVSKGACRVGWLGVDVQVGNSHMYSSPAAPPCIQSERGESTH